MKLSAGILLYRKRGGLLEVFLVHPGGPFWKNKDDGAWSIPKGECDEGADLLSEAKREFMEETGAALRGEFLPLTPVRQAGRKLIYAWAVEGELDPGKLRSNTFVMEWPPRSGQWQTFPEVDRGGWFSLPEARTKLLAGQQPLLQQLEKLVEARKRDNRSP
jgi:predicted NUDIX family NTP pyrophosphohydrolase